MRLPLLILWALALPLSLLAQNPNPCRRVTNSAVSGQVLSASSTGATPNCTWITGGGGPGGGTVTSFSGSGPSWLTWTVTNPTTTPAVLLAPTTGQSSHQVIGTCNAATTFAPCALVAGDIPSLASLYLTAGSDVQSATGKTIDGVTPTVFGFLDPTSSVQTQLNGKQAAGAYATCTGDLSGTAPGCIVSKINGTSFAGTSGHLVSFGAANIPIDSGIVATAIPAANIAVGALASGMTATTQSPGDNSTKIATTAYVAANTGGGSGLTLVEKHTAISSATLNFTTCITNAYDDYFIHVEGLVPASGTPELVMLMSQDGGSTYLTSGYISETTWVRLSDRASNGTTSTAAILPALDANSNPESSNANIWMFHPGSTSASDKVFIMDSVSSGSDHNFYRTTGGSLHNSATADNAFQFKFSGSINISTGSAYCYGIAKT